MHPATRYFLPLSLLIAVAFAPSAGAGVVGWDQWNEIESQSTLDAGTFSFGESDSERPVIVEGDDCDMTLSDVSAVSLTTMVVAALSPLRSPLDSHASERLWLPSSPRLPASVPIELLKVPIVHS